MQERITVFPNEFQAKESVSKKKTQKAAEQKIQTICDLIPVHPNIATRIQKIEEHSEKFQNLLSPPGSVNHVSVNEMRMREYEHTSLSKPRMWYNRKTHQLKPHEFEQSELKGKANHLFDSNPEIFSRIGPAWCA